MDNKQHNDRVAPDTGKEELLKITNEYPYFSIPWFYLLHDAEKNVSEDLENQRRKTSLFFDNTDWLNWQLFLLTNPGKNVSDDLSTKNEEVISEDTITENKVHIPAVDEDLISEDIRTPDNGDNISPGHQENISEELSENKINDEPVQLASAEGIADESTAIEFEPLHTVDYFASQGIKISDEPEPGDKLGNQLKSFTEWIKSMKKIHAEKTEFEDKQTDKNIQGIAEISNADIEVVTEAMAAVLIKQNKIGKAIEMYEKLSLNNPSKRAYFASKIESLKSA